MSDYIYEINIYLKGTVNGTDENRYNNIVEIIYNKMNELGIELSEMITSSNQRKMFYTLFNNKKVGRISSSGTKLRSGYVFNSTGNGDWGRTISLNTDANGYLYCYLSVLKTANGCVAHTINEVFNANDGVPRFGCTTIANVGDDELPVDYMTIDYFFNNVAFLPAENGDSEDASIWYGANGRNSYEHSVTASKPFSLTNGLLFIQKMLFKLNNQEKYVFTEDYYSYSGASFNQNDIIHIDDKIFAVIYNIYTEGFMVRLK